MTYEQFCVELVVPATGRVAVPREEAVEPEDGHDGNRSGLDAVQEALDRRN